MEGSRGRPFSGFICTTYVLWCSMVFNTSDFTFFFQRHMFSDFWWELLYAPIHIYLYTYTSPLFITLKWNEYLGIYTYEYMHFKFCVRSFDFIFDLRECTAYTQMCGAKANMISATYHCVAFCTCLTNCVNIWYPFLPIGSWRRFVKFVQWH